MDDNMMRMQQEAVERVRQMQERARRFVERDNQSVEEERTEMQAEEAFAELHPEKKNTLYKKGLSFLDGFGEDKDQLLLLLLAVLLIKSDAHIELVLALLYVAM